MANKHLKIPKIIEEINIIQARLAGSDRDDHIEEVQENERKVKDALLRLSIAKNEGIKILFKEAREHLEIVYTELLEKPKEFDQKYMSRQSDLFAVKDIWLWFISFFADAEQVKREVEAFVKEQLAVKNTDSGDDEY